jgi:hypothetical protein
MALDRRWDEARVGFQQHPTIAHQHQQVTGNTVLLSKATTSLAPTSWYAWIDVVVA